MHKSPVMCMFSGTAIRSCNHQVIRAARVYGCNRKPKPQHPTASLDESLPSQGLHHAG